jgi:hypothetical protein
VQRALSIGEVGHSFEQSLRGVVFGVHCPTLGDSQGESSIFLPYDAMNWTVEEFIPGGKEIVSGPARGLVTKDKWRVLGFYPSLKFAALALMDKAAPLGEEGLASNLLERWNAAEAHVLEAVECALREPLGV